jgi:seryl-tRNA synthetase
MEDLKEQRKDLVARIAALNEQSEEAGKNAKIKLRRIGNIVHQSVPVSNDPVNPYQM